MWGLWSEGVFIDSCPSCPIDVLSCDDCLEDKTEGCQNCSVQCCAVPRYYRGTTVPFFFGTSTVAFTVLFSTAIPQVHTAVLRHGTCPLLTHSNEHLLDCIVFRLKLQLSACLLRFTAKMYTFYLFILCCFVVIWYHDSASESLPVCMWL